MLTSIDVARFHPELALTGLALGLVAAVIGFRRPSWSLPAAAVFGTLVLLPSGRATAATVGAAVALAIAGSLPRHIAVGIGLLAVGTLALGLHRAGTPIAASLAVLGTAHVLGAPGVPGGLPRRGAAALVLSIAAALWLCTPDTEEIVVVGATLVPAMALGGWSRRTAAILDGPWTAPLCLLGWAAAQGMRGRPAAVVALLVIHFGAAAWPLAQAAAARTGTVAPRSPTRVLGTVAVVATIVVIVARTAGLVHDAAEAVPIAVAALLGIGAAWAWLLSPSRDGSPTDAAQG